MTTDVVVVAYNNGPDMAGVVPAAVRLARGGRVVVVDHGSDGSGELARRLGAESIVDPSNPGFGAGQNRGVAAGSSEFVLLLNPDARIDVDAIERGRELLERRPDVAAAQGVVLDAATGVPERSQGRSLGPEHLWGRALGARWLLRAGPIRRLARRMARFEDHVERVPEAPVEVEALAATALLVRRTAFESVRGFDERYFLYGEDLDLCRRLRDARWVLLALPEVWARHANAGSSENWVAREIAWFEGTMRFAARWWSLPALLLGTAASAVRALTVSVRSPSRALEAIQRMVVEPLRARHDHTISSMR